MILFILLSFFISFSESAIFYVKDNDRSEETSNLEFFKLLGLKVKANDLGEVISTQFEKNGNANHKFTLDLDYVDKKHENHIPDSFDYIEVCKSLVGTSTIPICRLYKNSKGEKKNFPRSCQEILESGNNKSGIYEINPRMSSEPLTVLCDMETKGGGWTHIQKRFDGSQDFYLPWRDYKFGFGDLNGEFWIGLENIYHITGFEVNELLIELTDREHKKAYAQYSVFTIGPEKEGYVLKDLKGFSGDAGDALTPHLKSKFSTHDVDQDENSGNCAALYNGAWWYKSCWESHLNGKYMNKQLSDHYKYHGLEWNGFRGKEYNLAGSRILVRPLSEK
ncbi:microfibril-associated glycoprotein 4-like [Diorhabda sublineata]|uniref:microfibril-associated glycoprotein 4-like n=1 Tax=Diorhabda sublineata TaxID=1163346 RepID=UPI0024E06A6A|nr:microfibril-associated glycoprotein 4-like [Diorhabda sublineata]